MMDESDYICHTCDNPPCVRPEHLFLGDAQANAQDMVSKGRNHVTRLIGSRHGMARFTEAQVLDIRERAEGREPEWPWLCKVFGVEFGVDPMTIRAILHRRTWTHIR